MAFTASLTGNIGRDPELKTFDSGKYKTELTVAVKQQDKDADAFYSPQPYSSWKLNKTSYVWESPVKHPNDGKLYEWNEEKKSWDLIE